jgi:DNA-directed RNA polymerase specialized sigma subunit
VSTDTDKKMVPMYRNKRADELTREELIEAYTHAVEELVSERRWNQQCAEMNDLFRDTARKLGLGAA